MVGGTSEKKNCMRIPDVIGDHAKIDSHVPFKKKLLSLKEILEKVESTPARIPAVKSGEVKLDAEEALAPEALSIEFEAGLPEGKEEEQKKKKKKKILKPLSKPKDPASYFSKHCNFVFGKKQNAKRCKLRCYRNCEPESRFCIYHSNK